MRPLQYLSNIILLISFSVWLTSCGGGGGGGDNNTGNNANLVALQLSVSSLDQIFQSSLTDYTAMVGFMVSSLQITATPEDPDATLTINGLPTAGGQPSVPLALVEGSNTVSIVATAEDGTTTRTYTIVVQRQSGSAFAQQAYIKASNTDSANRFAWSIALSGDTLAVGTPFESSAGIGVGGDQDQTNEPAPSSGAVYVFTRTNGMWSQQAYIKASNADTNDRFGHSVAVDGDTLAVGATHEGRVFGTSNGVDAGAVYVFTRSNSVWSQQARIKASNFEINDRFGESVALTGDTLAVGTPGEDSAATGIGGDQTNDAASDADTGAVYVFTRSNGAWTQQAYIKASNTGTGDEFGGSVALSGDTLAVGAVDEDSDATGIGGDQANNNGGVSPGAVYVFTRSNGAWTQQAYVKASNTQSGDEFGWAVALAGDTLAVAAPFEDSAATGVGGDDMDNLANDAGAVYVFTRSNGVWNQQAYVKASDTFAADEFGYGIALDGDTLAVGSSPLLTNREAVYVYERSGGVWSQEAYLEASNARGRSHSFGESVTLSGDTIAVGGPGEGSGATGVGGDQTDQSANTSGAVYIFQ